MRVLHRSALLAILLPASAGALGAQAIPNFTGTWVLQVAQSDFGPLPAPEAHTDVIDHREPRLAVARTATAQGQQTQLNFAYVVDGEPHRNNAGGADVVSRLRWEGATLVMISTATGPQGEVTFTDRYTLSADGRTLTQARTVAIEGQEVAQRMVLTRP